MTESTDRDPATESAEAAAVRVETAGIVVQKEVSVHGLDAVAVYLTLRSSRNDRCTVRVVDVLPDGFQNRTVEFHPNYDPEHWDRTDGILVYETTLDRRTETMTVYGVAVDDPAQFDQFEIEPTVEVDPEAVDPAAAESKAPTEDPAARNQFSFDETHWGRDASNAGESRTGEHIGNAEAAPLDESGVRDTPADAGVEDGVDAFITELRRCDLSEVDRSALRDALGLDGPRPPDPRLDALAEEVAALKEANRTADWQPAEIDRIDDRLERLSNDIEQRFRALAADVQAIEETVEEEIRWRERLRHSLVGDSDSV